MVNLANFLIPEKNVPISPPHYHPLVPEFQILRLNSLEEISQVVETIRLGKIAIILLNQLDQNTAQRVIDWLNGYMLAINGVSQWLDEQTFLFAPEDIKVTGSKKAFPNFQTKEGGATKIQKLLIKLEEGILLDMVPIPGGSFQMGSPESEQERTPEEEPLHLVKVGAFYMSKYPITQAQWRVVAALAPIKQELESNPSYFQGDNLPVEQVSWYDAMEFCARLSQKTGRQYRLPTEAEWEYACRAGTTTRYSFGETIGSHLANYDARSGYESDTDAVFLQQTSPVGHFHYQNAFGLSDLHGNVWEWCGDHWHENYQGAPTDGLAWLSEDELQLRVIRGGSWYDLPRFCRSACRYAIEPQRKVNDVGFRVVCGPKQLT